MSRFDNPMKNLKDGEKRFFVHLRQKGEGCDYTIACGQALYPLPKTIGTRAQAEAFVFGDSESEGTLGYHGGHDDIETVLILESTVHAVDYIGWKRQQEDAKRARDQKKKEADELALYEQLKAKLGK